MNGKRKFLLTVGVLVGSFVLALTGKLDPGGWVTISSLALSIYGAANVFDKKNGGAG